MAANVFQSGGVDNNWGTPGNWSLGSVPTSADGHTATFNATSPNCTVNAFARVCNVLDFTGYTNTITFTFDISVSGNITLGSGMSFSGTGKLKTAVAGTLTSNGKTLGVDLVFEANGGTYTLADNWTVPNFSNATGQLGIGLNGNILSVTGNVTINSRISGGTTEIRLTGTGTFSTPNAVSGDNPFLANNLTVNTAGTITFSGIVATGGNTLTYTAGTVITTGSTLTIVTSSGTTLNCASITWANVTLGSIGTIVLSANLNCSGNFVCASSGAPVINGNTFNIGGGITMTGTQTSGTTSFVMNGTGTWSGSGTLKNNLTFNTAGTITVSGNVFYDAGTITYTAGSMVMTGSTLFSNTASGSMTLNTSGMTWNHVTVGRLTITLTSNINVGGDFTIGNTSPIIINGAFNVNVAGSFLMSDGVTGTSTIILTGSGTWYHDRNSILLGINFTINASGTYTCTSGKTILFGNGRTMTHIAGTVVTTGSTLELQTGASSATFNTAGITWNNFSHQSNGNGTITLLSNINFAGNLAITTTGSAMTTINGAYNVNVAGSLSISTAGSILNGTSTVVLNGTGTWSGAGIFRSNLTFNTSGTITVSGTVNYNTGTLTYTAGTMVTTGSTLSIDTACTLNVNGMTWNNVSFSNISTTVTFSSNLQCLGNFTQTNTITFSGAITITVGGSLRLDAHTFSGIFLMNGTGSILSPAGTLTAAATVNGGLTINTAGTITLPIALTAANFVYVTGNISGTNTTLTVVTSADIGALHWYNVVLSSAQTITLSSPIHCHGLLTLGSFGQVLTLNGSSVNSYGSIFTGGTSATILGTSSLNIYANRGGTWTTESAGSQVRIPINFVSGTISVTGTHRWNTGTVTVLGTKVTTNSTSALSIDSSTSYIGMNKINWATVTVTSGSTLTMDKFFSGIGSVPTRLASATSGFSYNVIITGYNFISNFVQVSDCSLTPEMRVNIATVDANRGNNRGISFINNGFQGFLNDDWINQNYRKLGYVNNWGQGYQGFVRKK